MVITLCFECTLYTSIYTDAGTEFATNFQLYAGYVWTSTEVHHNLRVLYCMYSIIVLTSKYEYLILILNLVNKTQYYRTRFGRAENCLHGLRNAHKVRRV